jgi:ClpP class serine protease
MLFDMRPEATEPFEVEGDAAIVDVRGPVVQHKDWCWDSYDSIVERVKAATDSNQRAVVLRIDSPGGDALGMMEAARELRAVCRDANKPLIVFVDGMACSAAFALATAGFPVVVPPAGLVGSVGVFQPMLDATGADRAMGLVFEMVSSGERKLDGNPHVKITDAARAETQRRVDGLADLFFALVAEMRHGVSATAMRGLEGGIYLGQEAVTLGLADAVGSWGDVLAYASGDQQATAPAAASNKEQANMKIRAAAGEETTPDNDKKTKARKAFFSAMEAAFDSMFGDDEAPKKKEGEASAEDEDTKKKEEAKAKAEEDKKKEEASAAAAKAEDEKKKEEAKALAAKATDSGTKAALDMALKAQEDNAKLRAELAAKDEAHERAGLLAKRPDLTPAVVEILARMPLEDMAKAIESFPRGPMVGKLTPPGVLAATGAHGANPNHRGEVDQAVEVPKAEADLIAKGMGLRVDITPGVKRTGRSLELGAMTAEEARVSLKDDEAKRANARKVETV